MKTYVLHDTDKNTWRQVSLNEALAADPHQLYKRAELIRSTLKGFTVYAATLSNDIVLINEEGTIYVAR